jgi:hypothetical protein
MRDDELLKALRELGMPIKCRSVSIRITANKVIVRFEVRRDDRSIAKVVRQVKLKLEAANAG